MITCVTNHTHHTRSCTIIGVHTDTCDGFEFVWSTDLGREAATGRTCPGCLPTAATHGNVCTRCWNQVEGALAGFPEFFVLLFAVDRAVSPSGGGGAHAGPRLPWSGLQESMFSLKQLYLRRGSRSAAQWVKYRPGALDAVLFARAFRAAEQAFPVREQAEHVPTLRCPLCGLKALVWRPPTSYRSVLIECRNHRCSFVCDQSSFEALLLAPKRKGAVV